MKQKELKFINLYPTLYLFRRFIHIILYFIIILLICLIIALDGYIILNKYNYIKLYLYKPIDLRFLL